jgi:hypothetical protein
MIHLKAGGQSGGTLQLNETTFWRGVLSGSSKKLGLSD